MLVRHIVLIDFFPPLTYWSCDGGNISIRRFHYFHWFASSHREQRGVGNMSSLSYNQRLSGDKLFLYQHFRAPQREEPGQWWRPTGRRRRNRAQTPQGEQGPRRTAQDKSANIGKGACRVHCHGTTQHTHTHRVPRLYLKVNTPFKISLCLKIGLVRLLKECSHE